MILLAIIAVLASVAVVAIVSFRAGSRRAIGSAKLGPTPAEARIKTEADDLAARIDSQAEKDKQEVLNASGADLHDIARVRLQRPK